MFFAQPSDSFANMRKALRPGGRLVFACWRTPRDNPWMMIGLKEAYKFVPKLPEMKPDDPGPFSFADEERVRRILTESGFTDIGLERRSGTRHRHRPGSRSSHRNGPRHRPDQPRAGKPTEGQS
jgi:SAM-dependent methyltransferase